MKEKWEEEKKLKLHSQPQEAISVESFPEHLTLSILVTFSHKEQPTEQEGTNCSPFL